MGVLMKKQVSPPVSVAQVETSADITAQIDGLKAERPAALNLVEALLGKPFDPETFESDVLAAQFRAPSLEVAMGLRDRIVAAQFTASQIANKVQYLETRRRTARTAELRAGASRHAETLDKIARELIPALKHAARLNHQAMQAHETARREFGDQICSYIIQAVYNGHLRTDSVEMWAADLEKDLAVTKRKLSGLPPVRDTSPQHPDSFPAGRPAYTPKPAAPRADFRQHLVPSDPRRVVALTPAVKTPRTPDNTTPLEPGMARASVLRAGYEVDGRQCVVGQVVVLPLHIAQQAAKNTAIVITEMNANRSAVEGGNFFPSDPHAGVTLIGT